MNVNPTPTILNVSTIPITISDLFKGGEECDASVGKAEASVEKADASVEKANPSVGKMDASLGKETIFPLKHSLPFLDEQVCGPSLMAEETQNMQDPIVITSGANS